MDFMGGICFFGGSFAPRDWAFCQGQLMPISQNQALYAILGTIWGGDGRTSFALPDMRSRVPIGVGRGPGLTQAYLGQRRGRERNVARRAGDRQCKTTIRTDRTPRGDPPSAP